MEIDEYSRVFFQMEMEESLFSIRTPLGDPFWDVVRFEIYFSFFFKREEVRYPLRSPRTRHLLSWMGIIGSSPSKIWSMANQWARFKRIRPADFVAFVCSRYKDVNGEPTDFASEDMVNALSERGSIQRIESRQNLLQDVNVNTLISVAARVYRLPASYEQYFHDVTIMIADAQRKHLGVADPQLLNVIRRTYRNHLLERRIWGEILDRSKPRLVLMTQNGIQKGLILEARKRNIPIVECQHGDVTETHPSYSYPPLLEAGETVLLPDVLLLFSEHWKRQCSMPGTKLVVVGNNHFSTMDAR